MEPIASHWLQCGTSSRVVDFTSSNPSQKYPCRESQGYGMLRCWSSGGVARILQTERWHRNFRASISTSSKHEKVEVPCSSNGSLEVVVYHPEKTAPISPSVAIYLPRGSILENKAHDASNVAALQDIFSCHVVQINYRCDKFHRFPTPIHDVLAGFDWIIKNLLPKRAISRPGHSEHIGRLVVCGELIGGSLGLGLALSECRIGEPGVVAAAINNPIVDWTTMHDRNWSPFRPTSKVQKYAGFAWDDLGGYRDALFRKPAHYFDPFASPIMFFRSAELEVPDHVEEQPLDEMEELVRFEREESLRELLVFGDLPGAVESERTKGTKKRRVSRRFPSKALGLRLPNFRLESGSDAVVSGQAIELAHQLRQSFERQRKRKPARIDVSDFEDEQALNAANDQIRHCWHPGLGLWDDTKAGKERMLEAARWLKYQLSLKD